MAPRSVGGTVRPCTQQRPYAGRLKLAGEAAPATIAQLVFGDSLTAVSPRLPIQRRHGTVGLPHDVPKCASCAATCGDGPPGASGLWEKVAARKPAMRRAVRPAPACYADSPAALHTRLREEAGTPRTERSSRPVQPERLPSLRLLRGGGRCHPACGSRNPVQPRFTTWKRATRRNRARVQAVVADVQDLPPRAPRAFAVVSTSSTSGGSITIDSKAGPAGSSRSPGRSPLPSASACRASTRQRGVRMK